MSKLRGLVFGHNPPADLDRRVAWAVLGAVILVGAWLRLYDLGGASLSHDELLTHYTAAHESVRDVVWRDIDWSFHPPGYFVLMHFVLRWFGDSEWAMRLPSALAGVFTIPAIYALGTLVHSRRCGVLAAALCAGSTFLVYWSREARPYAILCLLTVLLAIAAFGLARVDDSKRGSLVKAALPYTLLIIAVAYVHYFGVLIAGLFGACLIALTLARRRVLITVGGMYVCLFAGYAPWLSPLWWQLNHVSPGISAPVGSAPREFLRTQNVYFNYLETLVNPALSFAFLAILFTCVAAWAGYVLVQRKEDGSRRRFQTAVILAAWFIGPFAFAYLRSLDSSSIYTYRNLIVSAPASFLVVSAFLASIRIPPMAFSGITVTLAAALAANLVWRVDYFERTLKDEIREATAFVVSEQRENSPSVIFVKGYRSRVYYYYFEKLGSESRPYAAGLNEGDIERVRELVRRLRPAYVWYLYRPPAPPAAFMDFLRSEYEPAGEWSFVRMQVLLFRVRETT